MKTFKIDGLHTFSLKPVTVQAETIQEAALSALAALNYHITEIPDTISLNKRLKKFDDTWHFNYKEQPGSKEKRAEERYCAYLDALAKEFSIDNSRAAQIAWIKGKAFYRPEMLVAILNWKDGDYIPDLPLMKWKWRDGKFVKKETQNEYINTGAF